MRLNSARGYRLDRQFRPGHDDARNEDLWLITMSDVMSLLLIFFLVWYALKTHEQFNLIPHQNEKISHKLLHPDPDATFRVAPVRHAKGETVIELLEGTGFDEGEARLTPDGMRILERIAPHIKENMGQWEVWIIGHTDDTPVGGGRWDSNISLSIARATAVWKYLVELGVSPTRLNLQGVGSLHPRVPNDTPEHRRMNRRVEIVLKPLSLQAAELPDA